MIVKSLIPIVCLECMSINYTPHSIDPLAMNMENNMLHMENRNQSNTLYNNQPFNEGI